MHTHKTTRKLVIRKMASTVPTAADDDPVMCDSCGMKEAKRGYVRTTGNNIRVCSAECFDDAHNTRGPVYFGYHTGPSAAADAMYANRPSGMMTASSLSDFNRILGLANQWNLPRGTKRVKNPEVRLLSPQSLAAHHPTTAIKRDRLRNETHPNYQSVEDMMTAWFSEVVIQKYMHTFGIAPAVFTAGIMLSSTSKNPQPRFATWIESTVVDVGLANAFGAMVAILNETSSTAHVTAVAVAVAAEITKLLNCVSIMHKNGIIHRDLYARNVMCNKQYAPDGTLGYDWKIIDYGMASLDFATRKELFPRILAAAIRDVDFCEDAIEDGKKAFDRLKWSKITDKGTQSERRTFFAPTFDAEQLEHLEGYNFTREKLEDEMYPDDYSTTVAALISHDDYLYTWDELLEGNEILEGSTEKTPDEILMYPASCFVLGALYCAVENDHWKKHHGKHTADRDIDQLSHAICALIVKHVHSRISTEDLRLLFADVIEEAFVAYIEQHPELYPRDAPEWNNAFTLVTDRFLAFKMLVMGEGDTTTTSSTTTEPALDPDAVIEPVPDMPRSGPRHSPSPLKSRERRERSRSRHSPKK